MERCIEDIRMWMSEDKLIMNADKTEFLLIGTRQHLAKRSISAISRLALCMDIALQPVAKNLGVWV